MAMMDLTAESLSKSVEAEVPEMFVVLAKNSVAGVTNDQLCEILGVEKHQLQEILENDIYKAARLLVAAEYARETVETDFSWDKLESKALSRLVKKADAIQDVDQLLRVAVMANKAQRRLNVNSGNKILDATTANHRVGLSLTKRITERLADGTVRVAETIQVSVTDGSAVAPTFEEVEAALKPAVRPYIPDNFRVKTHEPEVSLDIDDFRG